MDRWRGKVAIVTGASAGIGAAICARLVEEGCVVVGLARRVELVQQQAEKLKGKRGKLYAVKVDMSVEDDILKAFKWTTENLGPVHVLVNNAGVLTNANLISGETSQWKTVLDTNVLGLCIATREAIQNMQANKVEGHIVHINSITGHTPIYMQNTNVYGASKYAVTNLTEILRKELIDEKIKIKVSSISPGLVNTVLLNNIGKEEVQSYVEQAPKLNSEDVADAVAYVIGTPPHVQIHELTIKVVGEDY
ncbi:PREDICTED: farnesol dehydrogenase-like [Nicrophorus vespilloides]|uniref:Farnesol dehydrogenase-like n=1 Tax=Nicrophorus vespilloides TaxID=110193 RepID=A0ABM1MS61_NICVS|nr:PREDICTED: farnesol dehydrogenase-like [Nicrophorus vespilloides]